MERIKRLYFVFIPLIIVSLLANVILSVKLHKARADISGTEQLLQTQIASSYGDTKTCVESMLSTVRYVSESEEQMLTYYGCADGLIGSECRSLSFLGHLLEQMYTLMRLYPYDSASYGYIPTDVINYLAGEYMRRYNIEVPYSELVDLFAIEEELLSSLAEIFETAEQKSEDAVEKHYFVLKTLYERYPLMNLTSVLLDAKTGS